MNKYTGMGLVLLIKKINNRKNEQRGMKIDKDAYGFKSLPRTSLLCFLAVLWIACVSTFITTMKKWVM